MSRSEVSHSIQGSWRGCYYYSGQSKSHGFEAVFVEIEGRVEGNILDDGTLGEADVAGSFGYPALNFQKIYRVPGLEPVAYQGTMSEDGKTISGKWNLKGTVGAAWGTWIARRFDEGDTLSFETEDEQEKPKEVEQDREREKVRVRRRPTQTQR